MPPIAPAVLLALELVQLLEPPVKAMFLDLASKQPEHVTPEERAALRAKIEESYEKDMPDIPTSQDDL